MEDREGQGSSSPVINEGQGRLGFLFAQEKRRTGTARVPLRPDNRERQVKAGFHTLPGGPNKEAARTGGKVKGGPLRVKH